MRWIAAMGCLTGCYFAAPSPQCVGVAPALPHNDEPVRASSAPGPSALAIEVHRRDEDGTERVYGREIAYEGELRCDQGDPSQQDSRLPLHGDAVDGHFEIRLPVSCGEHAQLSLDLMPSYEYCRALHTNIDDLAGRSALIAFVDCDSPQHIARLRALSLLQCSEHATRAEPHGPNEFRVSGCGRSVILARSDD
jgi:hypothetical protein